MVNHALFVECVGAVFQRMQHLAVGVAAHLSQAYPHGGKVTVVREPAAELAVFDLAVVDVPVDEVIYNV